MKVLEFLDTQAMAGTEVHLHTLAKTLRNTDQKIEVFVGVPKESALWLKCKQDNIPLIEIPRRKLTIDPLIIRTLVKLLKNHEIHLIHAHNGRTSLHAAIAVRLARKGQFIYTQHFLDPAHTERKGFHLKISRTIHNWINKHCSHVIAISNEVQKRILLRGDVSIDKTTVIHNGIEDPLKPHFPDQSNARRLLGIDPTAFVVFSAGRLEKEKNMALLIQSIKALKKDVPQCHCYIAGEGSLRKDLESQISDLQLNDHIKLLGFRNDVHLWMRASNVFVLTSLAEPFGLVLLEAMALERPVIACNSGGPKEIIIDGKNGFLISRNQTNQLSILLQKLSIKNPETEILEKNARNSFLEKFSAIHFAESTAKTYRQIQKT